jgi:hypothetical protein
MGGGKTRPRLLVVVVRQRCGPGDIPQRLPFTARQTARLPARCAIADMNSRLLVLAGTALVLAVPTAVATASADVSPYQTQATFTVTTPYTQPGQWNDVWTHNYTVTVNPEDGSFAGIGIQYDNSTEQTNTETITGTFATGSVTFEVRRADDGVSWTLADATYGGAVTLADVKPGSPIEMKVTDPVFTTPRVWNHGDYVSETGSTDATQACIGKPIHINRNATHHRIENVQAPSGKTAAAACRAAQLRGSSGRSPAR